MVDNSMNNFTSSTQDFEKSAAAKSGKKVNKINKTFAKNLQSGLAG